MESGAHEAFPGEEIRFFLVMEQNICKHLHLAFKGKTTDEIYDILMEQLLRTIRRYDPGYSDKTRLVVETINGKLSQFGQITLTDVNRHLEFDADRHLRMLVRRGYLEPVKERGRIAAYVRSQTAWPPDAGIYGNPVGITYCIQTWFRCYLQQWIARSDGLKPNLSPAGAPRNE
jgi:hypothetical protein